MEQQVHVVCYVKEAGAYLDYNYRKKPSPLVPTNGKLTDIATKVARSFHQPWVSVLQYTYQNGVKHTGRKCNFPTNRADPFKNPRLGPIPRLRVGTF